MLHAFDTTSRRQAGTGRPVPAAGSDGAPGNAGPDGGATGEPVLSPDPLAGLLPVDLRGAAGLHPLHGGFELPSTLEMATLNLYDPTDFRRGLADWLAENDRTRQVQATPAAREAATAELGDVAAVRQVSDDIRSALIAATAIGLAHSVELLMGALGNHPLIRLSAVSHPFVLGTLLEAFLKKIAEVADPDPLGRIAPRYQEKLVAALVNWNFVQPLLDTVLKSPLARTLKAAATAGIGGVRDLRERTVLRNRLAELPEDAPGTGRKLTVMEAMFVVCLLCALRNVAVDLPRQVIRSQPAGALPPLEGATERLLRHAVLGSQVPGGLPAACIVSQSAFVEVVRDPAWRPTEDAAGLHLAFHANNPF